MLDRGSLLSRHWTLDTGCREWREVEVEVEVAVEVEIEIEIEIEVKVEGEVNTYMSSKVSAKPVDKKERPEECPLRDLYHFMPKSCHIAQFLL